MSYHVQPNPMKPYESLAWQIVSLHNDVMIRRWVKLRPASITLLESVTKCYLGQGLVHVSVVMLMNNNWQTSALIQPFNNYISWQHFSLKSEVDGTPMGNSFYINTFLCVLQMKFISCFSIHLFYFLNSTNCYISNTRNEIKSEYVHFSGDSFESLNMVNFQKW